MTLDRGTVRRAFALVGVFALSGCYVYVPADRPAPGTSVRVRVPVRSSVGTDNGDTEMVTFEGVLVSMGDTLLLETETREALRAHREYVSVDTLRVLRSDFEGLEERQFSRGRTAALTVGLIGGGLALVAAVGGFGGSEGDPKPGDTDNPQGLVVTRRPSAGWTLFGFRIPIPWPSG